MTWTKLNPEAERIGDCASQDCHRVPTERFESGGVGSIYCDVCAKKVRILQGEDLWCVHVIGSDDVFAMPSLGAARQAAHKFNTSVVDAGDPRKFDPNVWACPALWPHTSEAHTEDMRSNGGKVDI